MKGKLNALFGAQDMTVGSPSRNLIVFSIPLLLGNIAQLLYNTVDSIVVGKFIGDGALAAVAVSGPILNLMLLLFMGIAMGSGIMVSQYFGAKERGKLSHTVGTAITLSLLVSVVVMVVGPLLTGPILNGLNTPGEVIGMSEDYLVITFIGIIGPVIYNIGAGVLRGLGDSFMPLVFLMIACLLNIGLDVCFVAFFDWGVAGVAWATIIAQMVSAALCLLRLAKMKDTLDMGVKYLKPQKKLVTQLVRLGLPSGATQGIFSLAAIMVQGLSNQFGTAFMAMSNIVMRVDSFAMMPNFTFGTAMTTFTGQNIGAKRIDRVEDGAKKGMKLGLLVSAVLVGCLLLFGPFLMRMFTNTEQVIEMGTKMIRVLSVGYLCMAVTQILSGVMRGAGSTVIPMVVSIITTVIIRVPLAYGINAATRNPGEAVGSPYAIFVSLLISWVMGGVLTTIFFLRGRWKRQHELPAEQETAPAVAETVTE